MRAGVGRAGVQWEDVEVLHPEDVDTLLDVSFFTETGDLPGRRIHWLE